MERKPKKPFVSLSKNILITSIVFIVFLLFVLGYITYKVYTGAMITRYQKQLTSIIDYVEAHIDKDDMAECARTYEESETYKQFQDFFDDLVDHYSDVHYLYIMQAKEEAGKASMYEICAANTTYEKENEPESLLHLGDSGDDWYEEDVIRTFLEIQNGDEDVFLENESEWGVDYTLARPLVSSKGVHYALLCADVSIDEINNVIYRNIYVNILAITGCGAIFIYLLLLWLNHNVIDPIKALQKSVGDFAEKTTGIHDPDKLLFTPPESDVNNEVSVLSDSIVKLSEDMRNYVIEIIDAQKTNKDLKDHVDEMSSIVFKDSLTRVSNKAAYDKATETLRKEIEDGTAEFAILMMDVNLLKHINDEYGHEHGDQYIIGACRLACHVFKHSPIYRIGGDEFVAILKGEDYRNRDELFKQLCAEYERTSNDQSVEPWLRYSMAVGMSTYRQGDEVESVFNRADKQMYQAKAIMEGNNQN